MNKYILDDADRAIIALLLQDSRISLRAIAAQVDLAAPTVRERILRLEDMGIIESFTIRLNLRALGMAVEAVLRVEPLPGKLKQVEKIMQNTPEILECSVVTGEDCFVARLALRDIGDLDRVLGPLHDVARTKTSIVHRKPVLPRCPPI